MNKIALEEIKKKAALILKKEGATRAALFGSVVRGETRDDSDIDILVDLPRGKSLFDFVGIRLKLEEVLGRKVDLVEYSTIKPRLKPYILNHQVSIL